VLIEAAEITVRVVDSEEGRALNLQYRAKDYATNVLTFDYAISPVLCADLVLCAPVLAREAEEQGKDLRAHWVHLLVHGTLHAMGHDHEHSQKDAAKMEALEVLILQGLGIGNPY
jgi:probable rRNA maturation factor